MTNRDELRRSLIDAGRAPIESVDERLDAVEQRLLLSIDDTDAAVIHTRDPRQPRRLLATVAASLLIMVAIGVILTPSGDERLVIDSADGVEVVLPDGSTVDDVVGFELPDGALLDVEGSVVIDGRRYRAGSYRVDDGELVRLPMSTSTTGATVPITTDPPRVPDRTVQPPADDVTPARTTSPTTTSVATTAPVTAADPARPTTPPPTSEPVRTTQASAASSTEPVRSTQVTTVPLRATTTPVTTRPTTRPATTSPR